MEFFWKSFIIFFHLKTQNQTFNRAGNKSCMNKFDSIMRAHSACEKKYKIIIMILKICQRVKISKLNEWKFYESGIWFSQHKPKASIPCSLLVELFLMFLSNHLNKLLRGKWCIGLLLVINIINATSCHRNLIWNQCCLQSKKCYENCLIIFYCIPLLQKSDYQCNLGKYFLFLWFWMAFILNIRKEKINYLPVSFHVVH